VWGAFAAKQTACRSSIGAEFTAWMSQLVALATIGKLRFNSPLRSAGASFDRFKPRCAQTRHFTIRWMAV